MAPEAAARVRPDWPFWVLMGGVVPLVLDAFLLTWLGGASALLVVGLASSLLGALAASGWTVRRMPVEGRVGWGVIGLLVAGVVAVVAFIVAVVILITFTCGGDCV